MIEPRHAGDAQTVPFGLPPGAIALQAMCSADTARSLLTFDHHRVGVEGDADVRTGTRFGGLACCAFSSG